MILSPNGFCFAFIFVVLAYALEIAAIAYIVKSFFFWPVRQSQFFFELTKCQLLKEGVIVKVATHHQAGSSPEINLISNLQKWLIEEGGDFVSLFLLLHLPIGLLFAGFYMADDQQYWLYCKLLFPYAQFALILLLSVLAIALLSECYLLMSSHINYFRFLNQAQQSNHANKDASSAVYLPQTESIGSEVNHV